MLRVVEKEQNFSSMSEKLVELKAIHLFAKIN